MTTEERLAQLEKKLQYLTDRNEILDCISRNSRGCDRHDVDLLGDSYHSDGTDEHGFEVNPGPKYSDYANKVHTAGSLQNMHHITTHYCDIDGNVAHAESYVIGLFLNKDQKTARLIGGRYIDRLERKDGAWKIMLRRSTAEVLLVGDAALMHSEIFKSFGYLKGMRDKSDTWYQRPLTLDTTTAERW